MLSPEQVEGVSSVLQSLGIDPTNLFQGEDQQQPEDGPAKLGEMLFAEDAPTNAQEEVPATPEKVKQPKLKIPLEIAPGTLEAAKRFFELGKSAGNWYYDAHSTVAEAFGGNEQDMVLFTMILAATSVQNEVYTNLVEAAAIYQAIQADMKNKPGKLRNFALAVGNGEMTIDQARTYYSDLNLFRNAKAVKMMAVPAKFGNIIRTLKLWTETGSLTKEQAKQAIVNSLVDRKISKKQLQTLQPEDWFTPNNPFIGKMKIANFALTLLDPHFASSDENPFNVVVDTWMFRVFFPDFLSQGMDQKVAGRILNKLFASKDHYNVVASTVSQLAAQAGVSPHVMQAAIWTGIKVQWEGPNAEAETNYVSTLNTLMTKYGDAIEKEKEEISQMASMLKSLTVPVAAKAIRDRRVQNVMAVVDRNRPKMAAAKAARDAAKTGSSTVPHDPQERQWPEHNFTDGPEPVEFDF
jgi:polyhydroxyalkanoate synthesis regulator phasin